MKEEYKKFKQGVEDFISLLAKREERVLNLDAEIEAKQNSLSLLDQKLAEKQRLFDVQMDQLKNSLGSERDRAFRFTREAELKLAETETFRAMANQELAKAQEERRQVRLKLQELEEKEKEFAKKVANFKDDL